MKQAIETISVATRPGQLSDITHEVRDFVARSGIQTGLCTLFIRHTSASLIIQENYDPRVLHDLQTFMEKVAPQGEHYTHDDEGPDDMPSHIRAILTRTSEVIPVQDQQLVLGRWQAIYVWEHREQKYNRNVVLHISGE